MYVNFVVAVANGDVETIATMIEVITGDELPAEAVEAISEMPKPVTPVRINGNTIRDVKSLTLGVREHIVNISKNPGAREVPHWKGEIKTLMNNICKGLPRK